MRHTRLFAVSTLVIALVALSACVGYPYRSMHDWNVHGFGIGAIIAWMVFIGVVAVVVYVLYRLLSGAQPRVPSETPLDILKKRYARGEISKEQFDAMKRDLVG